MKKYNHNKGTALFITGIVISIALAVGIGVSSISLRELRITRTILPSFQAFYAADAGVECAFYWANPARFRYGPDQLSNFTVACLEDSSVNVTYSTDGQARVYTFERMNLNNGSCVTITVRARENVPNLPQVPFSQCLRIDSFGKNDCSGGSGIKVERGLLWKEPVACPDDF